MHNFGLSTIISSLFSKSSGHLMLNLFHTFFYGFDAMQSESEEKTVNEI